MFISHIARFAPSEANAVAMAFPMPLAAPVTTAVRPRNPSSIFKSPHYQIFAFLEFPFLGGLLGQDRLGNHHIGRDAQAGKIKNL